MVRSRRNLGRALLVFALVCVSSGPAWSRAGLGLISDTAVDGQRLGSSVRAAAPLPAEERRLLLALEAIGAARLDVAEQHLRGVLDRHPTFRLAQLVYADVLLARSGRLVDFGSGAARERVELLRAEALARVSNARNASKSGRFPGALVQLAPSQRSAVVVDVRASRLYVYSNDGGWPRLARSYYVSTAKNGAVKHREGDQRTPVGVYFVTGKINGKALPDFYGPGALPVNYPNEWDMRLGRTGYGIWIHGVPSDTFARPPRASDGCMALSNEHLVELLQLPQPKDTPVIIASGVEWLDEDALDRRRRVVMTRLDRWRRDWESRDVGRYARHYSRDFRSDGSDLRRWMAHKRRVNAAKRFIKVALNDLSAFFYPGEPDMMVVSFEQDYRSSNFSSRSRKRQYWRKEPDGQWRVVYEGSPKVRPEHLRGMPFSARARVSRR